MDIIAAEEREAVEAVPGVFLSQLAAGDRMSVQHYFFESGASVPEHSHHHEQAGFVTDGTLTFVVDGEERRVTAGESYVIPPDEPHAAANHGDVPVVGVDIFSPARTNPDWAQE